MKIEFLGFLLSPQETVKAICVNIFENDGLSRMVAGEARPRYMLPNLKVHIQRTFIHTHTHALGQLHSQLLTRHSPYYDLDYRYSTD